MKLEPGRIFQGLRGRLIGSFMLVIVISIEPVVLTEWQRYGSARGSSQPW
jgi:hypothetical protein